MKTESLCTAFSLRAILALTAMFLLSSLPSSRGQSSFRLNQTRPLDPMPVQEVGLLPGDAAVGPAAMHQTECRAARGGNQFLIVWTDERATTLGGGSAQSGKDIFGIRLDAAGNPIDPAPFAISTAAGWQQSPTVTWNGENWLVSFYSQDPTQYYYVNNIRGVRVSPAGEVLDPIPLMLVSDQQYVWVAGQNGQWLVTWYIYHDDGYGTYLVGRRLNGNGQFIDPAPVMLMDWTYLSNSNKVLAANGEYLVVGQDWYSYDFKARRVGFDGQPIGQIYTPLSPNVGTNGTEFLIAWIPQFTTTLRVSRMMADGTLLNPPGALLYSGSFTPDNVTITNDGTNWFVGWSINQPRVGRVNAAGNVLDLNGVVVPVGSGSSYTYDFQVVAGANGGAQAFYDDYRAASDANVFNIPLTANNVSGPERVISTGTPNQHTPGFTFGPNGQTALAFISKATDNDRILVHLLAPDGQPLLSEPLIVAQGASLSKPGIAWNGSIYLVAWNDTTTVKARRMNADGSFIDPVPIDVMPGFNVDVAALGSNFCVTASYLTFPPNPQYIGVFYRRVSDAGVLLDATPINVGTSYAYNARIHAAGDRWVTTWEQHPTHDNPQASLQYAFIFSDGMHTSEATAGGSGGQPDVAFNGEKYLFVWRNNSLSNANNYIAGRILNAGGSWAGSAFVIDEALGRQLRPVVGWDGTNFVVAWDDQRNQLYFYDERTDIYGARVTPAGVVLDPAGFPIFAGPNGDATTAILSKTSGVSFVASARFTTELPHDSYRVGLTVLGASASLPLGAISRKTHGVAGTFDVNLPLSGTPAVECRTGGVTNDYQLLVNFSGPVTVNGNPQAAVTSGTGTIGSGGVGNGGVVTVSGNTVTIPLTNVANAQTINVTLFGVNGAGNVMVPMSVLVGDANANGTVNASDVALAKSQIGQALGSTNFRTDVNANGAINAGDATLIKSLIGTSLP